jgi:hypothetical protein
VRKPNTWLFIIMAALLSACGDATSPEDRIRTLIDNFEQTAEQGRALGFKDYIADNYSDADGQTKRDVLRLLAGYKLRKKSIHLLVHIADIQVGADKTSGSAKVFVAMAASPLTGVDQFGALQADLYRFDIELRANDDDTFQVSSAKWAPAEKEDFFPGSEASP